MREYLRYLGPLSALLLLSLARGERTDANLESYTRPRIERSRALLADGKPKEAVVLLREVTERAPDDLNARIQLADALERTQDIQALEEWERAYQGAQVRRDEALLEMIRMRMTRLAEKVQRAAKPPAQE